MAKLWMILFIALIVVVAIASGEAKGGRRPRPRTRRPKPHPTWRKPTMPDFELPDCPIVGMHCDNDGGPYCCAFHKCNEESNTCEFGV